MGPGGRGEVSGSFFFCLEGCVSECGPPRQTPSPSVCESKLQDTIDDSSIQIDGYLIHRLDRNRHGGGVILYIKASLNAMDVQKLRPKDTAHEYFWVRFTSDSRPVYICSLYRPPSADSSVFDSLSKNLAHIQSLKKDALVLLLGDFNTHNNERLGSLNGLGRPINDERRRYLV